jgi:hypothetical protein
MASKSFPLRGSISQRVVILNFDLALDGMLAVNLDTHISGGIRVTPLKEV